MKKEYIAIIVTLALAIIGGSYSFFANKYELARTNHDVAQLGSDYRTDKYQQEIMQNSREQFDIKQKLKKARDIETKEDYEKRLMELECQAEIAKRRLKEEANK